MRATEIGVLGEVEMGAYQELNMRKKEPRTWSQAIQPPSGIVLSPLVCWRSGTLAGCVLSSVTGCESVMIVVQDEKLLLA